MTRKPPRPQHSHHVMIYDEDWEWIERHYGPGGAQQALGISGFIKETVRQKVQHMKARAMQLIDSGEISVRDRRAVEEKL